MKYDHNNTNIGRYKPQTPEEVKALKALKAPDKMMRKYSLLDPPTYWGDLEHAEEGVRMNGWQRPTTAPDILKALNNHAGAMDAYVEKITKARDAAHQAANLAVVAMAELVTCKACKGEKGEGEIGRSWEDCHICGGAGVVPKRKLSAA